MKRGEGAIFGDFPKATARQKSQNMGNAEDVFWSAKKYKKQVETWPKFYLWTLEVPVIYCFEKRPNASKITRLWKVAEMAT